MKNHLLLTLLTVGIYTINAAQSPQDTLAQLTGATAAMRVSAFTAVDKDNDDVNDPKYFDGRKKPRRNASSSALFQETPSPETVPSARKRSLSVPIELAPSVTREEIRLLSDIKTIREQIEKLEKGQRKSVEGVSNHTVSKKNEAKIKFLKSALRDAQRKLSLQRSPNNLVAPFLPRVSSASPVKYPTPITPSPLPASPTKFTS